MHRTGDVATLADDDARKLVVVLRKTSGAALEIVDSSGRGYAATLIVDGERVRASLDRELAPPPPDALRLTLAQGIPKGQKMDFVVEKATELGAVAIRPFASERTVGHDAARDGKLDRWRRLAKSAAQQCGRSDVPAVDAPIAFAALVESVGAYDAAFVPWELEGGSALRERLPALLEHARDVLVVIGPEGGFSHCTEAKSARCGRTEPIRFRSGRRILAHRDGRARRVRRIALREQAIFSGHLRRTNCIDESSERVLSYNV